MMEGVMTPVSIIRGFGLLAMLCVAAASCSRASGANESASTNAAATSAPAPAGMAASPSPTAVAAPARSPASANARSACDLVTAEEASAILGESVVATEVSHSPTSSFCSYAPDGDRTREIQLKVEWNGGKEAWDAQEQATGLAGRLLGGAGTAATNAMMKAEAGSLGDKFSYNAIIGAFVLKGDVLLEFQNLVVLRDARSKWEKLAATALAKL
jgi:hypothetical protein